PSINAGSGADSISIPLGITLDEAEKIIIRENLALNRNNKSKTADMLGIGRKTLQRRLAEWGLEGESGTDADDV
ncbi:MAG: sigma-54-dependent Fis family transcriptional regulator, partial [Treponema sp.]|nr:sigma-54-dependent Fis family transcriptional regulator [Treponema sp.]